MGETSTNEPLPSSENFKTPPRFIAQTIEEIAYGVDRNASIDLLARMGEISKRSIQQPEFSNMLNIAYDYISALRGACNRNNSALEYLHHEHPELQGKETEYLIGLTLDRYPSERIDKAAALEKIVNAGDDVAFRNYQGVLMLEYSQRGRQLLEEIKIMPKNSIGLFVPLKNMPYIIVPKEGDSNRRRVIAHEVHHFAFNAIFGEARDYFSGAKDEFMAYVLEHTWIPTGLRLSQLVYDQKYSLETLPQEVIEQTESFLLYALICQAFSTRGHYSDDKPLSLVMTARDNNELYNALDLDVPFGSEQFDLEKFLDKDAIGRILSVFLTRQSIAKQENPTIDRFSQAFLRLIERKQWDKDIFKKRVLQYLVSFFGNYLNISKEDTERERIVSEVEPSFDFYRDFFVSSLGEEISLDEFTAAIIEYTV